MMPKFGITRVCHLSQLSKVFLVFCFVALGLLFATPQIAAAATFTWTGGSAVDNYWTTPENWGGAAPGGTGTDDLVFPDGAARMSTSSNDFPAATTFNSIQFSGTTAGYTLGGNQITLGAGGISSANTSATNTIWIAVVVGDVRTVTVSDTGGTLTLFRIISGSGGLIKAGPGQLTLSGNNTFTGGSIIQAGTVRGSSSNQPLGTGTVTLGDTSGSSNATVLSCPLSSGVLANPIVLSAGTTGTLTLGTDNCSSTFAGGVTGTNNLTLKTNSPSTGTLYFINNSINNIGTITNSGSGLGTVSISGGVGSNVTAITQSSTTSPLEIRANPITVNSGGTTLTAGPGAKALQVYGGVVGTGNLILNNNNSLSGGIYFSTLPVNNTGTITSSGSGTGSTSIGYVGSNVTAITHSMTSALSVGGITVNSGGTTLTSSPGAGSISVQGGVVGTGNLILNNNSSLGIVFSTVSINNIGTITNSGSGTGTTYVDRGVGSNVTAITQSSTTSALEIRSPGQITVNSGGTTLTNTLGGKNLSVSGGVAGTGNLILNNNSSLSYGIYFYTGSINNTGAITNSGSGTGSTSISAVIGNNVTGIEQSSTTSPLTLSGANTFTGGVTLHSGVLNINSSTALGAAAGTFTIKGGTINNTSAGAITTNNYPINWNGDFTFTGTKDLNFGTGTVTIGADTQATINAGTLSVGSLAGDGYKLTKAGGGTLIFADDSTLSIGSLDISGGTLNSGNSSIDVTGTGPSVWNIVGTFLSTGAVTFSGDTPQIGDSTFTDLTIVNNADFIGSTAVTGTFTDNTGGSVLTFNPGSTYSFANLDINGTVGNNIVMTSPGTWFFNVAQADPTVTQVSVDHSDATGGNTITATGNSINNGGNTNWLFPPDAPTIGTATGGDAQATVTFTAPASDGGSAITGYTVTSLPAGGVDSDAGTMSLSHVVTGLNNGTSYTFTVTATSGIGPSAPSAESNAVIPVTVPDAPTIGTATGGNAQATVTFTAPAFDGGSAITGYTVTSLPAGGVDLNAGTTSLSHTIVGLTNRTQYTFTVTATNSDGTSIPSAESNAVTPASTAGGGGGEIFGRPACSGSACYGVPAPLDPADVPSDTPTSVPAEFFTDISGHWAQDYIEILHQKCGVDGYEDVQGNVLNHFSPDSPITRRELVKMSMQCKYGDTIATATLAPFPDVKLDMWGVNEIAQAEKDGMVQGKLNGNFAPDMNATRAEAAKIIELAKHTIAEIMESDLAVLNIFSDVEKNSWYGHFLAFGISRNYFDGHINGLFRPEDNLSRGEAAKILVNVFGL